MNNAILLTEMQAAELAQVKPKTIADWGRAGKLPRVRLSARCIRYRAADVQAMIDANLQQGLSDTVPAK
jgi:predicted site-specific integrase-resolvase